MMMITMILAAVAIRGSGVSEISYFGVWLVARYRI